MPVGWSYLFKELLSSRDWQSLCPQLCICHLTDATLCSCACSGVVMELISNVFEMAMILAGTDAGQKVQRPFGQSMDSSKQKRWGDSVGVPFETPVRRSPTGPERSDDKHLPSC